ncbi:type II toxin-antitoxin system RelE/ParE family toxin [Burkholderia gladioli]|uniref:type II toxin-antitoxin system RelE family toxin n=1 Tax=Burkholderia gladioli TaxID=28095 RepID=UPI00164223A5
MNLNLKLSKQAQKAKSNLDAKQFRQVITSILGLMSNPTPHDSSVLRGASRGERKLNCGEYRVIYRLEDNVVEVLVIGPRNDGDVYDIWSRRK